VNFNKSFRAIFLAYTSLLLLGLGDNIRGPLYPEILKAFELSDTSGSLFFVTSSAFGFLGGLMGHRLEVRMGSLAALRAAILMMSMGQLMVSVAPSFWTLLLGAMVFGLSFGVMGVIQNMLVVREIPAGALKNKVVAGLHSMYAGASLLAPVLVNLVLVLQFGISVWRMCFAISAFFGLVIFALTFWGPPLESKIQKDTREEIPQGETAAMIFVAVLMSAYVLAEILISSRMALYMRRQFDASLPESSWYTAAFFVGLLAGRVLFTFWAPNCRLKTQLAASLFLSMVSVLVGIWIHPAGLAASGFFMGPFYPLMIAAVAHLFPHSTGPAMSWAISLASLFVVLMHFFVGLVTDLWNLQTAFYLGPFFCALSLGMLLTYEKIFHRLQSRF
jgi:FHS family glucose/mannose:H+ symporter-like MFS transporter